MTILEMCSNKQKGLCPFCAKPVSDDPKNFTDELSLKEFRVSGICQECQDKFWKEEE